MGGETRRTRRFDVVRLLGEGGSGKVWLVRDRRRGNAQVALKELVDATPERATTLACEFATLTRLRHPNLVEVYDLEPAPVEGSPYFTLEHIDGVDVAAAVATEGPELWFDVAAEALRALAFLHDFGLIHRDLKPGNLLVRGNARMGCRLVLLDFGLAMRGQETESSRVSTTAGTLPYLAPELFDGAAAGPRSDLYALGVVLFEAIHGHTPFRVQRDDLAGFVDSVRAGRRTRPPAPEGYPKELTGWLDEMLAGDPAKRPAGAGEALARLNATCGRDYAVETAVGRAARLASGSPPGRDAEVESLLRRLESNEGPQVLWLCGGPGSGKKRILRWIAAQALGRGFEVLSSPRAGELPGRPDAGADRILADLRDRAARTPTLLILHGVENAGHRVLHLIERVAREGREAPLQVIASLRPAEVDSPLLRRMLSDSGKVPSLSRENLEPLDRNGLQAMIARATGNRAVSRSRLDWFAETSQGNALLAQTLLVEGVWERDAGRKRRPSPAGLVASRLDLLPAGSLRVLEALAIVQENASAELLAAISEGGRDEIRDTAAELEMLGLARGRNERWFIDSSSLAQQVVASIPAERRRELYRRAGLCLERKEWIDDAEPFLMARLWSGAGDVERTIRYGRLAAELEEAAGDSVRSAEHFAFVLRHLPRRDPRRLDLRLEQGRALRAVNRPRDASRAFGAAARLARTPAQRADILSRQAVMLVQAGRFDRARAVAERALELAIAEGALAVQARAKEAIGTVLGRQGHGLAALPWLAQAVAEFEQAGEGLAQAHALQAMALAETNEGLADADEHFEQAIRQFQALGSSGEGLISRVGLAFSELRAARFGAARKRFQSARQIAIEHHNLLLDGVIGCTLAQNSVFEGRYAEAIELTGEAEDQGRYLGDDRMIYVARGTRALALLRCGRTAEAAALARSTLKSPGDRVDPVHFEYLRLALAEAQMAARSADEASVRSMVQHSLARARELRDPDTLLWGLCLELEQRARPGAQAPAGPILAELDSLVSQGGAWDQPFWRGRADLVRAQLHLARGETDEAVSKLRALIDWAETHELYECGAAAAALLCELLEKQGLASEAQQAQSQGLALFERVAQRIGDADLRRGFEEREAFRRLREPLALAVSVGKRLSALYDMVRALNSQSDPDALLESALDMALNVVNAERGMILLRDPITSEFTVHVARNLETATAHDAVTFSRNIVAQAGSGRSLLAIDAATDVRFRDLNSVSLYGIHSLMCVPLRTRGIIVGTVYLDNRNSTQLFTNEDLRFLEAFADHCSLALENARERAQLERENRRLQSVAETRVAFGNLVGNSEPMQRVFELIEKVAQSDLPVLIQGESGTGKELVARAIHFNGARRKRAFVSENCAAIPESLLQTELFGHVRGAFTGAERDRPGLFEQAHHGSLFLDEVGDMPGAMQSQLLRALQQGEIRRVGAEEPISVDVRVIAATHRDIPQQVRRGAFREDLMYRLQVLTIAIPPLRERPGDVQLLIEHFLDRIARDRGRRRCYLDDTIMRLFEDHAWPGNVRQLEGALQRLTLLAGEGTITLSILDSDPALARALRAPMQPNAPLSLVQSERERIAEALAAAAGNRTRAARLLGVSRATIYRKIKEYRL